MSFLANLDSSDEDGDDSNLFSHAARNQKAVVAAKQQQKAAAKAAKQNEKDIPIVKPAPKIKKSTKRKSSEHEECEDDEHEAEPRVKRKVIDQEQNTDNNTTSQIDTSHAAPPDIPSTLETLVPRQDQAEVILSDDSEPGKELAHTQPTAKQPPVDISVNEYKEELAGTQPIEEESPDDISDDEYAEITRRARLKERQKRLEATKPTSGMEIQKDAMADRDPEPKIEIFLSSNLPNTTPLRVFIRISQKLGLVRAEWCRRQNFPPECEREVYLTYRGRRIYDVSSCRSLGLDVDQYGQVIMRGASGKEGVDKVHLEAVTDRIWDGQHTQPGISNTDSTSNVATSVDQEPIIRVILTARDVADYKVRIKPSTPIWKLVSVYKKHHGMSEEQIVVLLYDGEELALSHQVSDTEISDMDQIEVHMR